MASPSSLYKPILFLSNLFIKLFKRNKPAILQTSVPSAALDPTAALKTVGVFLLPRNFLVVK